MLSVKHNLALVPSAVLCVASRAISITITGLPRYLNPEYLFLQVYVEHCLAHRGSSVQVKPVSSGGVIEYNIGRSTRSTRRIKNALGYEYVQLDNQQDRRAGIRSSVSPDWGIYQIFYCRTEHWSHLFARNLRGRFQKNKSASQFACLLYHVVPRWANGKAIC